MARVRNKRALSSMRSSVKKVLTAETPEAARENLAEAMKCIDKAAKNHVIHENAAARKKGQLSRAAEIK